MSTRAPIPVLVLHLLELQTPETLGPKIQEFCLRNHQAAELRLVLPERDPQPVSSAGPQGEI